MMSIEIVRHAGPTEAANMRRLLNALSRLHTEPGALSAARVCLDALERAVPCRASLVHMFDAARSEFVVVHARGEHAESMILERQSTDDPLLRVAMPRVDPFAWDDLRRAPVSRLGRFSELSNVVSVLVCPLVAGTRWLGAIELVDPKGGESFRPQDLLAAQQVASRYSRFLTARGVVIDTAAIARFATRMFPPPIHTKTKSMAG
jgi:GAF domain-containing protein